MKTWALVIGLDQYPVGNLLPLHGAVADAVDFAEWALHPNGGAVAHERFYFWTYPAPVKPGPLLAAYLNGPQPNWALIGQGWSPPNGKRPPFAGEIVQTIQDVGTDARDNAAENEDKDVRRIYVFLAGHGLRSKEVGNATEQTCFIAGDFSKTLANNVQGLVPCESLRKALLTDRYDEALFFLDCCRLVAPRLQTTAVPITDFSTEPVGATWGVGNAAQDGKPAFETTGNPVRGAFSMTLMEGLRTHRGADGALHMEDLRQFVRDNIRKHTDEDQRPSVLYNPTDPSPVVLGLATIGAPAPPPAHGPLIDASAVPTGTALILKNESLVPVETEQPLVAQAAPFYLPVLPEGLYSIEVSGSPDRRVIFRAPVAEAVRVP